MPSTYEPIASLTTTTTMSLVSLTNIPQNYNDLVLVVTGQAAATGADVFVTHLNGDNNASSTSYGFTALTGTSGVSSYRVGSATGITAGNLPAPSTTDPSPSFFHFNNYSNATTFKNVIVRSSSTSGGGLGSDVFVGTWRQVAPITSISMRTVNGYGIKSGTTFALYGLTANNLKATGGDIIQSDGTYWYHAFTSSGVFTPVSPLTCDVLVIAGGGGGTNGNWGGGSGAGGLRSATSLSVSGATTVTVGAGGTPMTNGSNSIFSSITSTGGGIGGQNGGLGTAGGSGGGASGYASAGTGAASSPTTSPAQGNSGGRSGFNGGNGGGGAGGAGSGSPSSPNEAGGNGGVGSGSFSSWASITNTGLDGYYAGGGGGAGGGATGTGGVGFPGIGGLGGGGQGANGGFKGGDGARNTGGGAGGTWGGGAGATGGSGLVIVRYAV